MSWTRCSVSMPPEDEVVMTKIDDENGERNTTKLVLHNGLWWFPNKSMYVYYSPTHWRRVSNIEEVK